MRLRGVHTTDVKCGVGWPAIGERLPPPTHAQRAACEKNLREENSVSEPWTFKILCLFYYVGGIIAVLHLLNIA
ncbi:unnamed protein product, partial [Brenthis ino]